MLRRLEARAVVGTADGERRDVLKGKYCAAWISEKINSFVSQFRVRRTMTEVYRLTRGESGEELALVLNIRWSTFRNGLEVHSELVYRTSSRLLERHCTPPISGEELLSSLRVHDTGQTKQFVASGTRASRFEIGARKG